MASCFRVSKASIGQNQLQPTLEMVRVLLLTACATVAAAQFNIKHTQYGTSPPVYPSPRTCGAGGWDAALEKAQTFVADLTTEEKAQIITGNHALFDRGRSMADSRSQALPVHVLATLPRSQDSISAGSACKTGLLPFDRQTLSLCSRPVSRQRRLGIGRWFVNAESTWAQSSEAKVPT